MDQFLIEICQASLILNVDGCIAVCFVDLLRGCGEFSRWFVGVGLLS